VTTSAPPTRRLRLGGRLPLLAAAAFWPLLAVWTWKLLEPNPVPVAIDDALSFSAVAKFVVAKCLHAGAYATLAGLVWVWVPARWRWAAVAALLLHGVGTELAQHLMNVGRTGTWTDVLIDWAGTAAGLVAARRLLQASHRNESSLGRTAALPPR
jgi:hypothetical protein